MQTATYRLVFRTLFHAGLLFGSATSGLAQSMLPDCLPRQTDPAVIPRGSNIPTCTEGQDPGVSFPHGGSPLYPDSPPVASLITISTPGPEGTVTVTGSANAATPGASLLLVTLDTGHYATTQAGSDGSFATSMFAPAGTSVLIKSDVFGGTIQTFVENPVGDDLLTGLAGTILRVASPGTNGTGVAFAGAGLLNSQQPRQPPAWTLAGTIDSTSVEPGGNLRVQGTLSILAATLNQTGAVDVRVSLERISNTDGSGNFAQNLYASTILTPTGLPLERPATYTGNALTAAADVTMTQTGANIEGAVDITLSLPEDLPAGYYRPFIVLDFHLTATTTEQADILLVDRADRRPLNFTEFGPKSLYLPITKIGSPAAPQIPLSLLVDTLSNATRGTRSVADRERFGIASRILTQSETFVIPRVDAETGKTITYRLEPFALSVSVGDRGTPPAIPLIPFSFPSGGLSVTVESPDGVSRTFGPFPFVQSRMRGLVDSGGMTLGNGGGHITDAYQLSTMNTDLEATFDRDGLHTITLNGTIDDIWGNTWTGGGTYEVWVAQDLSLDTAVLPSTPFEVGDVFSPGVTLTPGVPASVEVRYRLAQGSDASRIVETRVAGTANRFGYFYPSGSGIVLDQTGEYRVDVTASFEDDTGNLWMGSRTWGGVIAPTNPSIVAHGRRGIDEQTTIGNQWFFRTDTGIETGSSHLQLPFNSGDVTWLQDNDAMVPVVSFQDPGGQISSIMGQRAIPALWPSATFEQRVSVGEIPLFSSTTNGWDPHIDPSKVDLWAYSYRSIQRPLVSVREQIAEDRVSGQYWRFNDQYGSQLGVGPEGDLPNDIKFQYGAVVVRGSAVPVPQYAIYGSLFALIPEAGDAKGGSRTFPPFQGNGGGPDGGPIMTLKGEDVDLFIHLTGVRAGTILEVGDTFSIAGAVGPTLAAAVSTTVTMPSGQVVQASGQANRIGYYYQPGDDFTVGEAGVYTVDVTVTYEGTTSAGGVTTPFPTGDVLGTANGRFSVYVVPAGSDLLGVNVSDGFVSAPVQLSITATSDLTLNSAHVTAMMPGFVLEGKSLPASGNSFGYAFDASTFVSDFPNLDTDGSDVVTLTLFASGTDAQGQPSHRARHVVLHGRQLISLETIGPTPFSISNLGGTSLATSGGSGAATVAYGRIQPVSSNTTPSGLAIFGLTTGGVLVTEAAVPVSPLIQTGRIYAEVNGPVNTGVAIANPNASEVTVSFSFTDANGEDFGHGQVTIPASGQIAAFLNESPFNGGSTIQGTFFFSASIPVSVIALRGFSNERSEFLITTLPVGPLSAAVTGDNVVFPHFADGGGWTTQVILVNPSNAVISGSVAFRGQGTAGAASSPVGVTIDGTTASSFAYTIPPRSSRRLPTTGASSGVRVGSVRVTAGINQITPTGLGVFSLKSGGFTVAQAGVPALAAGSAFRVYAEASGDFAGSAVGSIQTGIAIANTTSSEVPVTFELTTLSGVSTGLTGSVTVPNNGQAAMFLNQIEGLEALGVPFQGVLRISSPTPINVVGLRGRYNERGDFLITTTSPVDEASTTSSNEMVFPHLVDSGGYTTQIILFSGAAGQSAVGNIRFFNQAGTRLNLSLN